MELSKLVKYQLDAVRAGHLTRCDFSDGRHLLVDFQNEDEGEGSSGEAKIPFYQVPREDVLKGSLPSGLVERLFKKAGKTKEEDKEETDSANHYVIVLEVAWATLREKTVEEGDHGLTDAIMSIPVVLTRQGDLGMPRKGERIPIMPRALLEEKSEGEEGEPKESDVFVGSYATYRQAAERASGEADCAEDWAGYLAAMQRCFDSVVDIGAVAQKLEKVGLLLEKDASSVQICLPRVHATRGIEGLGERIRCLADGGGLPLYAELVRSQEELRKTSDYGMSRAEAMRRHCGAMGREYPLSPSQRHAMRCLVSDAQSPILAVSGPPGTGKTTLLQAIVANIVVQKALAGEDAPIIVGSSTNNQAVTNIVDTFASVGQSESENESEYENIYRRWLPDPHTLWGQEEGQKSFESLKGIGCFFPSRQRRSGAVKQGYYVSDSFAMGGIFEECLGEEYCGYAIGWYRDFAAGVTTKYSAVEMLRLVDRYRLSLIDAVEQGSIKTAQRICRCLNYMGACDHNGIGHGLTEDDCSSLESLDVALDTKVRPLEFWLALHHYEWRWLEEAAALRQEQKHIRENGSSSFANLPKDKFFHALCRLTPLLTMTLYRMPTELRMWSYERGRYYDYEFVDLLIVDEAGQVNTPLGAPSFALAKRAVVMGDVKQIPPVWDFEDEEDKRQARVSLEMNGMERQEAEDTWRSLRRAGLTASRPSSLMLAAQRRCGFASNGRDGQPLNELLLTEHYRCQDEIVAFCNELMYGGNLVASCTRKVPEGLDLPPMSYCEVYGSCKPRLASKVNKTEAARVVSWLKRKFKSIAECYPGVDRGELVGVVTPFREQALLIRRLMREDEYATTFERYVVVGTAHALQGAERCVVLFSLVYDSASDTGFVDKNPELLNVAVSRAKDAFLLFAHPAVLRKARPASPIGMLAKHVGFGKDKDGTRRVANTRGFKGEGISLTQVIRRSSEDSHRSKKGRDLLRTLDPKKAHWILKDLGYLSGRPGAWTVEKKGEELGITTVERVFNNKKSNAIVYDQKAAAAIPDILISELRRRN